MHRASRACRCRARTTPPSSYASGSSVKGSVVLLECAAPRSTVLAREYMSGRSRGPSVLRRPAHHRTSTTRARPALSTPLRMRLSVQSCALRRACQCAGRGAHRRAPRPCEYAAPAVHRSCATAGIGHAAHAGGCSGGVHRAAAAALVSSARPRTSRSRQRCAVCEQNTVTANPCWSGQSKGSFAAFRLPLNSNVGRHSISLALVSTLANIAAWRSNRVLPRTSAL